MFDSLYKEANSVEISGTTALILGEDQSSLEQNLCRELDVPHTVVAPERELGLYIALRAAGVKTGDKVMCSGLIPAHVLNAILLADAVPVLVDINPNTYCMDAYCLDYVITKCKRTKKTVPSATIASDAFGLPCNLEAIEEVCQTHGITLLDDAGGAYGARIGERAAGSFGRFGMVGFPELDECVVTCHSADDAAVLQRMLRQVRSGLNAVDADCQDSVRAGKALACLHSAGERLLSRRRVDGVYRELLADSLRLQVVPDGFTSACTSFTVSFPNPAQRDEVCTRLQQLGIPNTYIDAYIGRPDDEWGKTMLRNAQTVRERLVTIPMHSFLTRHVARHVARQILAELKKTPCMEVRPAAPATSA